MIDIQNATFAYPGRKPVLTNISLTIPAGQHCVIAGSNGAGKSTLARLVKGAFLPQSGTILVDGIRTDSQDSRDEIMRRVGLVFQNPDDTMVATTVERELAFGLENLGVPRNEMTNRVADMLNRFDLERYRFTDPAALSGGEKQRLALAAVMIMKPGHLVLDEPTSLLDPWCRNHILELIHDMADAGHTVIHITQFPDEAVRADRVIELNVNGVCFDCPPDEWLNSGNRTITFTRSDTIPSRSGETLLTLDTVGYTYGKGTPGEHDALRGITLDITRGEATVLLGPTGSGKTTLLELLAGVSRPTSGNITVPTDLLRAMAFQFPEDQMFGDTVAEYISFGPSNCGVTPHELPDVVDSALHNVGLEPSAFRERDPLALSGGEKRRVALAGVLAMNPGLLVLDEPFAGLDRTGTKLLLGILDRYTASGGTLVFSTHDFDVARLLADTAIVMKNSDIEITGNAGEVVKQLSSDIDGHSALTP